SWERRGSALRFIRTVRGPDLALLPPPQRWCPLLGRGGVPETGGSTLQTHPLSNRGSALLRGSHLASVGQPAVGAASDDPTSRVRPKHRRGCRCPSPLLRKAGSRVSILGHGGDSS